MPVFDPVSLLSSMKIQVLGTKIAKHDKWFSQISVHTSKIVVRKKPSSSLGQPWMCCHFYETDVSQQFEFSQKVRVTGSNPCNLLKSSLLYYDPWSAGKAMQIFKSAATSRILTLLQGHVKWSLSTGTPSERPKWGFWWPLLLMKPFWRKRPRKVWKWF